MPTREILDARHPYALSMLEVWKRTRAFGEGLDTDEDKKGWLPQGSYEGPKTYAERIRRTQDLGASPVALKRLAGALLSGGVTRTFKSQSDVYERFVKNAGGANVALDEVLELGQLEALMVGMRLYFVFRPQTFAANAAQESVPIIEQYAVEELFDWRVDPATGRLEWLVLRRESSERASPDAKRTPRTTWIVATRSTVTRYVASGKDDDPIQEGPVAVHNLGIVPVVVHYGLKSGPMQGFSYVDSLSRADLRRLILESDNSLNSALHCNPRLKIRSRKDVEEIASGPSRTLILDPEAKEDAEYLQLDATGMQIREAMIASGDTRGAMLSGADPSSFANPDPKVRTGTALAISFSAAEAPILDRAFANLEAAEAGIFEVVARYLAPANAEPAPPEETVFDGRIERVRDWRFMSLQELIEVATTMWEKIKSPTWRRSIAEQLATRAPGSLPADVEKKLREELAKADYSDAAIKPDPPTVDAFRTGVPGGNPTGGSRGAPAAMNPERASAG